jgi:hypothetical protein
VPEQARATAAGREWGGRSEDEAVRPGAHVDRQDERVPVGAGKAKQRVVDATEPASGALGVDPRTGALRRRRLRLREGVGKRGSAHLGRARARRVGPGDDPLDVEVHVDSHVVLAEPAVPEDPALPRAEQSGGELLQSGELLTRRLVDDARATVDQNVTRARGESVLARVERERDAWVAPDPRELLAEPERRREADRSGAAVAQPHRRDGDDHGSAGRCPVREGGHEVAGQDRVDLVVPDDAHVSRPGLLRGPVPGE